MRGDNTRKTKATTSAQAGHHARSVWESLVTKEFLPPEAQRVSSKVHA